MELARSQVRTNQLCAVCKITITCDLKLGSLAYLLALAESVCLLRLAVNGYSRSGLVWSSLVKGPEIASNRNKAPELHSLPSCAVKDLSPGVSDFVLSVSFLSTARRGSFFRQGYGSFFLSAGLRGRRATLRPLARPTHPLY